MNVYNILWSIGFLAIFIPWINFPIGLFAYSGNDIYPMKISSAIESIALLIMTIFIEVKSTYSLIHRYFNQKKCAILSAVIFSVILIIGGWGFYKLQPDSVIAFTPYNDREANAISGIRKEHGIYRYIDIEGQITLKADGLLSKGLLISFDKNSGLKNDEPQMVAISVNGELLEKALVGGQYNHFIYVPSNRLSSMPIGQDVIVRIDKEERDNPNPLNLLYAGPAKLLSFVKGNHYIAEEVSGIDENSLWMGKEGHILVDTSHLNTGFLIQLDIPDEFMKANRDGNPFIRFTGNGRVMKEVPLEKKGRLSVVIQPEDLNNLVAGESVVQPLDLGIIIEAEPPAWDEEDADKAKRQEFLKLHYIGALEDRQDKKANSVYNSQIVPYYTEHLPLKIFTKEDEFFYTNDLKKSGLTLVYFVPRKREAELPVDVSILLDDKRVGVDEIGSQDFGKLRSIHVKPDEFGCENHIVKVSLRVNSTVPDNVIEPSLCLIYRGPSAKLHDLSPEPHKTNWMATGLKFNTLTGKWNMGRKAQVSLVDPAKGDSKMILKYEVSPFLIESNPSDNIGLEIFVNDKLVRHIDIKEPGHFTETIDSKTVSQMETEDGFAAVTIKANAIYDPSLVIKGKRTDEEKSIDILGLGFVTD